MSNGQLRRSRIERISLESTSESQKLSPGSRRSTGRLFHADGEEMANARGPIVDVCDLGTNNVTVMAERRCERPTIELIGVKYRTRKGGVDPWKHRWARKQLESYPRRNIQPVQNGTNLVFNTAVARKQQNQTSCSPRDNRPRRHFSAWKNKKIWSVILFQENDWFRNFLRSTWRIWILKLNEDFAWGREFQTGRTLLQENECFLISDLNIGRACILSNCTIDMKRSQKII